MASAAIQAWSDTGEPTGRDAIRRRYFENWAWYNGTAFQDLARRAPALRDSRVYANTSLVYKHVQSVVDFYATTTYQGDLSTDGKPLPNGTLGAIPIDPQTGDEEWDRLLRVGIAEQWSAWNWRQNMSLVPMIAAALGDCGEEIVDDVARGAVYPAIVPPWRVADVELDFVDNVKAYTLEWQVTEHNAAGQPETYLFRKEVDGREYRYFRDDQPFESYPGGAVQPNPYGFVPFLWNRHRRGWGERGVAATDGTRQALLQLNSLLSHSFDFQQKAFKAPLIVRGRITQPGQTAIAAPEAAPAPGLIDRLLSRHEQRARRAAQSIDVLETENPHAAILQAQFDIGKTLEIVEFLKRGILEENPEGSFYHQLREMSQLTGPAVERALGDAASRCRLVRNGADTQTVKRHQMALAIAGWRANGGDWAVDPEGRRRELTRRQRAFLPFGLDSYKAGALDFGILDRPVVLPTEQERINLVLLRESVATRTGLVELGRSEDIEEGQRESEVDRMLRERREAAAAEIGDFQSVDEGEVA